MSATLEGILNLVSDIQRSVTDLPSRINVPSSQVTVVSGLSDIDQRLGLVVAGEFRAGNGKDPGKGFTGVRIAYPPMAYGTPTYNIVGVNADVLQFGLRATDGVALAGAGNIQMDAVGLTVMPGAYISFREAPGFYVRGTLEWEDDGTYNIVHLRSQGGTAPARAPMVRLRANNYQSTAIATLSLSTNYFEILTEENTGAYGSTQPFWIDFTNISTSGIYEAYFLRTNVNIEKGLNLGNAVGATAGQLRLANGASGGAIVAYDGSYRSLTYDALSHTWGTSGTAYMVMASGGAVTISSGSLTLGAAAVASVNFAMYSTTSGAASSIEIGAGGSGNRFAYIDFVGDATYTDYGLRVIRNNSGANTSSTITHRGTGSLVLHTNESANIEFWTANAQVGVITPTGTLTMTGSAGAYSAKTSDAGTNTAVGLLILGHESSAGASIAANFGIDRVVNLQTTANYRTAEEDLCRWAVATDASRRAYRDFYMFDATAGRLCLRLEATGTAAAIGFLGTGAVARQNVTGSRGGNAALASLLTALANFGLITDSTSA